ncbi:MAG: pyridoxal phosphate-dependent aminotransferase [Deltaproteobacteria bacterium]|nr:pyridoxal phosphate-dependent aminotransferase [Deltaproteobacteria bacterium]
MPFAQRTAALAISPTLATAAKAKALAAQGISVIDFSMGEPDFDTPAHIKAACAQALTNGMTKYGPAAGLPALRTAIAAALQRDCDLRYQANEILVTCGAKEALFAALQVLVDSGDEVIVPAPYWVSYPEQVKLCGGVPVFVETQTRPDLTLTATQLEQACTSRTKVVMLNSPSNPTGVVYSRAALAAIGRVCAARGLWVISDEMYDRLVYPPATFSSFVTAAPECREQTILVNGLSKTYAMTGWRIGYAAGPAAAIDKMTAWHSQVVTHPTSFAQHGAVAALSGDQACVATMHHAFQQRRDATMRGLRAIPGLQTPEPAGAFFAFPNVTHFLGRTAGERTITTSLELADYLLDQAHVAVVAGEGFGAPGFIRLSYALEMPALEEGLKRLATALAQLQ